MCIRDSIIIYKPAVQCSFQALEGGQCWPVSFCSLWKWRSVSLPILTSVYNSEPMQFHLLTSPNSTSPWLLQLSLGRFSEAGLSISPILTGTLTKYFDLPAQLCCNHRPPAQGWCAKTLSHPFYAVLIRPQHRICDPGSRTSRPARLPD